MSRPHGYQRYIHDGCRCATCTDANRQHAVARREIEPLRALIREQTREGIRAGKNAAQIAATICRADDDERADWLRLFVQHEVDLVVLRDETHDLPRGEPEKRTNRSGRWELVASLSKQPLTWTVTTPGGRLVALADCKAEDLEALIEQYAADAAEAERWAKALQRLVDEMDAADVDRVGELPADVVEEALEL